MFDIKKKNISPGTKVKLGDGRIGKVVKKEERVGFEGYVEPDNIPAQRCCEASGFHLSKPEPDEEGFLKYIYP